jgi:serine/threonine-protein kinase
MALGEGLSAPRDQQTVNPDLWHKIVELADAASALQKTRRAAFLEDACRGNDSLRKEVESLLAADEQSHNFVEGTVFPLAAELIVDDEPGSKVGQEVGGYEIVDLLGVGGMGEVYLAHHKRLRRKVALKFLPAYLTNNGAQLRRFEQEARAASALNHPNILTVYEVGESAGTEFIATEFIEGKTLRHHMENVQMTLGESLDVAIQLASALAVAHQAGIVHRDIKPENIMLRPDGYIKVLDFGLATMSQQYQPAIDSDRLSEGESSVQKRIAFGTPHYMSPEQARCQQVDARTDIFSLGAVIYEMLTSRKPFDGKSSGHVVSEILEKEPPPISEIQPAIPAELAEVVTKALQKNREARYQTAAELNEDLKSVRLLLGRHDLKEDAPLQERSVRNTTFTAGFQSGEIAYHWKAMALAAGAVIVLGLTLSYLFVFARGPSIDSLAIMPFLNVSSDANLEYLSDGMADHLTNSLSGLPGLTVISSNAAARYHPRDPQSIGQNLQVIGHDLKVQAVVLGKVSQQGNHIQVSVELVDLRSNRHLWGQQYDRDATDILGVQEDIAESLAEIIRPGSSAKQRQLSQRHTESNQAYQSYLRGRYAWNQRTEADLRKAIDFFNEAIRIDPQYALAYAGVADTYEVMAFHGELSPRDYFPMAKAAAERALEIDDSVAEAHTALAYEKFYYEWDWQGAEREFKRAIELNPNYATAHQWYGELLGHMGRAEESLAERQKALRLDPLSPIIASELGFSYYEARKYDQAVKEFRKAVEKYPDFSPAHDFLSVAYEQSGLHDEALAECQKAMSLSNDEFLPLQLALIYARSGRRDDAQRLLADVEKSSQHRYYAPTHIAMVYAALADRDKAIEWLDNAYEQRHWGLTLLKVYPEFDPLRSDPRFADLLRRLNFPQ